MDTTAKSLLMYAFIFGLAILTLQAAYSSASPGQDKMDRAEVYAIYVCYDENMSRYIVLKMEPEKGIELPGNFTLDTMKDGREIRLTCMLEKQFTKEGMMPSVREQVSGQASVTATTLQETGSKPATTPTTTKQITEAATTQAKPLKRVVDTTGYDTEKPATPISAQVEEQTKTTGAATGAGEYAKDLFERGAITLLGGIIAALTAMLAWRLLTS